MQIPSYVRLLHMLLRRSDMFPLLGSKMGSNAQFAQSAQLLPLPRQAAGKAVAWEHSGANTSRPKHETHCLADLKAQPMESKKQRRGQAELTAQLRRIAYVEK